MIQFGEAKERQVKTAKASTDVMKGVMVLKVKADGSAHVKKVRKMTYHYFF